MGVLILVGIEAFRQCAAGRQPQCSGHHNPRGTPAPTHRGPWPHSRADSAGYPMMIVHARVVESSLMYVAGLRSEMYARPSEQLRCQVNDGDPGAIVHDLGDAGAVAAILVALVAEQAYRLA